MTPPLHTPAVPSGRRLSGMKNLFRSGTPAGLAIASCLALGGLAAGLIVLTEAGAPRVEAARLIAPLPEPAPALAALPSQTDAPDAAEDQAEILAILPPPAPKAPEPVVRDVTLEPGDTLSGVLERAGASRADALAMIEALRPVYSPRALRAGQVLQLTFAPDAPAPLVRTALAASGIHAEGIEAPASDTVPLLPPAAEEDAPAPLLAMTFRPSVEKDIHVRRGREGYEAETVERPLTERAVRARGTIESSLYVAATDAGVSPAAVAELIKMFSYDVDFQRDIQKGDGFEVFFSRYEDEDGATVKTGDIEFASLTLSGKTTALYRFTPSDDGITDFFDAKGRSAKKFLMRTPVDGARISSGYGMRRHPILGYSKMHRGVDFAAPTGTPVMAAGHGRVEYAGWRGSFGKYIMVRHANGYATAYAHLSRLHVKTGERVRQGQVIARVGSTGRSTGPHLHYEVHVNGKQVNPVSVKLPTGRNLEGRALKSFEAVKADIEARMARTPVSAPAVTAGLRTAPAAEN